MPESRAESTPTWVSRVPRPLRPAAEVVAATAAAGGEHDLALFAPAMAYALVVSLAPLTLALQLAGASSASVLGLSNVPIASQITPERVFGQVLAWAGPLGSVVAIVLIVIGASALFGQYVAALNRIWEEPEGPGRPRAGIRDLVRRRLFAVALLLVAGIALFASAVAGNAVAGIAGFVQRAAGGIGVTVGWLDAVATSHVWVDFAFSALLFSVAFATVPVVRPRFRDVVPGALLTAVAYALGQVALSSYLGSSARFSALGSFGTFIALLVWAYYTALIALWGAELAHELARRRAAARGVGGATE